MKITITSAARIELDSAAEFYEQHRAGVGADFIDELTMTYHRIKSHPKAGKQVGDNIRYQLVKRFPYSVYYIEFPSEIVILAVAHQHRKPDYWRSRIESNDKVEEPDIHYAA